MATKCTRALHSRNNLGRGASLPNPVSGGAQFPEVSRIYLRAQRVSRTLDFGRGFPKVSRNVMPANRLVPDLRKIPSRGAAAAAPRRAPRHSPAVFIYASMLRAAERPAVGARGPAEAESSVAFLKRCHRHRALSLSQCLPQKALFDYLPTSDGLQGAEHAIAVR